jgi:hypothetical protein
MLSLDTESEQIQLNGGRRNHLANAQKIEISAIENQAEATGPGRGQQRAEGGPTLPRRPERPGGR